MSLLKGLITPLGEKIAPTFMPFRVLRVVAKKRHSALLVAYLPFSSKGVPNFSPRAFKPFRVLIDAFLVTTVTIKLV